MKEKEKYASLIDRYLSGEMGEEDICNFETELRSNKLLRAELQFEKDLRKILSRNDVVEFRDKVSSVINEAKNKQNSGRVILMSRRRVQLIAASVAILIAVSAAIFFLYPRSYSYDKLFTMYFDSDRPVHVSRSGDVDLVEALKHYQQKDYENAIVLFNEILKEQPANFSIRFYTAISYIETKQFYEAIEYFNKIIEHNNNLYVEPSQWYLGLSYLGNHQPNLAVTQFEKVAEDPYSYYHEKAKEILDRLKILDE